MVTKEGLIISGVLPWIKWFIKIWTINGWNNLKHYAMSHIPLCSSKTFFSWYIFVTLERSAILWLISSLSVFCMCFYMKTCLTQCVNRYKTTLILSSENALSRVKTYFWLLPRILPTTRFDIPIPIICIDVVKPIAVPTVAWLTTSGIEGHMLACKI